MRRTLGLLLATVIGCGVAPGCSNDLDDLYERAERDAGLGAEPPPSEPPPTLPMNPDEDRIPECTLCMQTECRDARAECLEDDGCIDELRCKGTCDDPGCLQKCSAESAWSLWYADYARCMLESCTDECNIGSNWQCEHEYTWPVAAADADPTFTVTFRFEFAPIAHLDTRFPPGDVLACKDEPRCAALDRGRIGIDASADLELTVNGLPPRYFSGYLELPGPRELRYLTPLSRSQPYYTGAPTLFTLLNGPSWTDGDRARISVQVVDCLGSSVPGATVDLPDLPDATAYAVDLNAALASGELDPDGGYVAGPTLPGGIALIPNIPDSATGTKVRVQASRGERGALVSQRAVWLRPGYTTHVVLGPATRFE